MISGAPAGGKGTWCCRQAARCACGAPGSNGHRPFVPGAHPARGQVHDITIWGNLINCVKMATLSTRIIY